MNEGVWRATESIGGDVRQQGISWVPAHAMKPRNGSASEGGISNGTRRIFAIINEDEYTSMGKYWRRIGTELNKKEADVHGDTQQQLPMNH